MKNTLLAFVITALTIFSAQAQDYYPPTTQDSTTSEFKPVTGDRTLEVGFNLQYGVFLDGGQIKYRKFTTDKNAFRLGVGASFDLDNPMEDVQSIYGVIRVSPGLERHFTGTSRFSPYIGAEVPVAYAFSQYEDQVSKIKGGWGNTGGNRGYWSAGLNALAGVDFYIIKNFYVGVEIGAGVAYQRFTEVEVDYKENFMEDQTVESSNRIHLDTFSNSGFRLGFVF